MTDSEREPNQNFIQQTEPASMPMEQTESASTSTVQGGHISVPMSQGEFTYEPIQQNEFMSAPMQSSGITSLPSQQGELTSLPMQQNGLNSMPMEQFQPISQQSGPTSLPLEQNGITSPLMEYFEPTSAPLQQNKPTSVPMEQGESVPLSVTNSQPTSASIPQTISAVVPMQPVASEAMPMQQAAFSTMPNQEAVQDQLSPQQDGSNPALEQESASELRFIEQFIPKPKPKSKKKTASKSKPKQGSSDDKLKKATRPFSEFSPSYKNKLVHKVKDFLNGIAGGDLEGIISFLCESNFGQTHLFPYYFEKKTKQILTNVKDLYQDAPNNHKPAVLSLVANEFPYQFLLEHGVEASRSQYSRAATINKQGKATLKPYTRIMPPQHLKTSDDTIRKIIYVCQQHASVTNDRKVRKSKWIDFPVPNFSQDINYLLHTTKKSIYLSFKQQFPETKMSLSTFFKYVPNNFISPALPNPQKKP